MVTRFGIARHTGPKIFPVKTVRSSGSQTNTEHSVSPPGVFTTSMRVAPTPKRSVGRAYVEQQGIFGFRQIGVPYTVAQTPIAFPTDDSFRRDVDLFATNAPLRAALAHHAPALDTTRLQALGQRMGSAEMIEHARLATPVSSSSAAVIFIT